MNTKRKRILFISDSLGLGHVNRDLAIAAELRRQNPDIELSWLAAPPASLVIENAGEVLLPQNDLFSNCNTPAEKAAEHFGLNLVKYVFTARKAWERNARLIEEVSSRERFDLVIGEETYEVVLALAAGKIRLDVPFVMIYDFLGLDVMSGSIIEKLGMYNVNRQWCQDFKVFREAQNLALFVGEPEDIEDKTFGHFLPNRREHARKYYHFVGYVLHFDPADFADRPKIRSELGYGPETLVVCSIGGTSVGKNLLELCGQAYPIIKEKVPDLRMVIVCGPRLSADSLRIPPGPIVREYVQDLYRHHACCDLAILQGGGTATLELTALRRPFLYFPLAGHCEQINSVAARLARHRAGVRMSYEDTTPELLANQVIANLGQKTDYAAVRTNGAAEAARLISLRI